MTTLAWRPLTLSLAERRAMLYSPDFWQVLGKYLSPFDKQAPRLLAVIARHREVSVDRVQRHFCDYLRVYSAIIHPGNGTVH